MKNLKEKFTNKSYRLKRDVAPLSYMLPSRHSNRSPLLHFDEEKGTNRPLRYARNQKSPFEDEQDGNIIRRPVDFLDGFLRVPKSNPVLQEFLHYHPLNGLKYTEVNEEKDAQKEVDLLNLEVDALIEAKSLSLDQLETISRVILGKDTSKVTTAELRRDILIYVRENPEEFMKIINDPLLKLQSTIQLFFDKSLLTFRNKQKEVWFNTSSNKKKMLTVPFGEDPIYIVSSYLQSDDGVDSLKMLEKLI